MSRKWIVGVAAGILVALAAFGMFGQVQTFQRKLGAAQALASRARDDARVADLGRKEVLVYTRNLETQADSLRRALARRRVSTDKQHAVLQVLPVPDTCRAVAAEWGRLVDSLQHQRYDALARGDSLAHGVDTLTTQIRADSAVAASQQAALRASLAALSAAPGAGTSFIARLLPHVYLGPQAGLSSTGKPYAGLGVSLAWRLF
jgi:hypothetical protein